MDSRINRHLVLTRALFFVALGLTISGGVLEGSDEASDLKIGLKLAKAGYSLVVVFVACLLAIQVTLWTRWSSISNASQIVSLFVLWLSFLIILINLPFYSAPEIRSLSNPIHNRMDLVPLPVGLSAIGPVMEQSEWSHFTIPFYGLDNGVLRCGSLSCHGVHHSSLGRQDTSEEIVRSRYSRSSRACTTMKRFLHVLSLYITGKGYDMESNSRAKGKQPTEI